MQTADLAKLFLFLYFDNNSHLEAENAQPESLLPDEETFAKFIFYWGVN